MSQHCRIFTIFNDVVFKRVCHASLKKHVLWHLFVRIVLAEHMFFMERNKRVLDGPRLPSNTCIPKPGVLFFVFGKHGSHFSIVGQLNSFKSKIFN